MKNSNMQRRDFLKSIGLGAAMLAAPRALRSMAAAQSSPPEIAPGSARPNVLWISAEDISPRLGCYGDPYATTPNLDRLAGEGLRYERAFTHAPVCAPSRSGIITGMYPTGIGTTWMRCRGVPPVQARCFPEYLRAAGYYCTNNSKTDYQFAAPGSAWDECSGSAHWRNRKDKRQPFFAVFNLGMTHESSTRRFQPGQKFDHDPAKAPVPPYYPDTQLVRENIACCYDRMTQLDAAVQKILDDLKADGLAEDTIVWFWGDHGWGLTRGKRWVYDSGLRVPLLIRVPEKHRAWAGAGDPAAAAPGRVEGELVAFLDYAPTMLSLAGLKVPPHMQGQAFLGPQKARQPRQCVFGGRDRMDETYDFIRCCRDKKYKLIRNYMPYLTRAQNIDYMDKTPILQEMRRLFAEGKLQGAAQLQFFEPTKPVHELYDVEADPHEVNNLAADPQYAPVVQHMQKAIDDWMKKIGDVGFIPECDFDEMKGSGKTAPPVFAPSGGGDGKPARVALSCPTQASSITYRIVSNTSKTPAGGDADPAAPNPQTNERKAGGAKPAKADKRAKGAKGAGGKRAGPGPGGLLYVQPIELNPGQTIEAQAWRLGYSASPVAVYAYGQPATQPGESGDPPVFWRDAVNASGMLDRCRALKAYDGRWSEGVAAYLNALSDKAAAVRYWAVEGLHQAAKADPSVAAARALPAVEPLLRDPSASVRTAAGEALCDWGKCDQGLAALLEVVAGNTGMGACYAAWALWRLGDKARPILPQLEKAKPSAGRYPSAVLKRVVARLKVEKSQS